METASEGNDQSSICSPLHWNILQQENFIDLAKEKRFNQTASEGNDQSSMTYEAAATAAGPFIA